ncbi:MAG: hypothetical protein K8J09_04660 [Planctomycetes bacterium]|nr:hypothetical protein [Planctomycetota bacterium]MCC7396120.1 hypothetical protein [Planctomycetota bacterium]
MTKSRDNIAARWTMAWSPSTTVAAALDLGGDRSRKSGYVAEPAERQPGILALLADPTPMQALLTHLRSLGITVDVASGLAEARRLFFGAGGHDCLVVGPDVRPAIASRVLASLRTVDPELATATFGPEVSRDRAPTRTAVLAGFHPSSRAGQGALLRFLRTLRLR